MKWRVGAPRRGRRRTWFWAGSRPGLGIEGLEVGVLGFGFGVWGLGFGVQVWGVGFGVWDVGFRV